MNDYYAILGVSPDAGPAVIREAWRRLAFEWHPDRNSDRAEEAHTRFLDVSEAWSVLRDASARRAYDSSRLPKGQDAASERSETRPEAGAFYGFADEASHVPPRPRPREPSTPFNLTGSAQTLQEYRFAVRVLARELATSDRSGRWLDMILLVATCLFAVASLGSTVLFLIHYEVLASRPPFWVPAFCWMGTIVTWAWFRALRERRAELYRPLAEEVLQRTGHGWRGPEPIP